MSDRDWREDGRGFSGDPDALKKALCGLIWYSPLFALGYVVLAVLAAL